MSYLQRRRSSGSAELAGHALLFSGSRSTPNGPGTRPNRAWLRTTEQAPAVYRAVIQQTMPSSSRPKRYIASLRPVAEDVLAPFLTAARADLFDAARLVHRTILAHVTDPEHLDDMLSSRLLDELPDALAIALLRGTSSFRPALKHWSDARDIIRDRMRREGKNVETVMRGLL